MKPAGPSLPAAPAPPPATSGLWRTIVVVLVTFVATSALWFGAIVVAYFYFIGGEPPFVVALEHPPGVRIGEPFDLRLQVRNASSQSVRVSSIDLYDSFLGGFEVLGSQPPFESRQHTLNFETLWYAQPLAAGAETTIRLQLQAARAGQHFGQVDVCTAGERCTVSYAAIEVSE